MKLINTMRIACLGGALALIGIPGLASATHDEAIIGDAIDGDGNGVFMGNYTHDATNADHPWYTFDATAGDNVTIDLVAAFNVNPLFGPDSFLWVYRVLDDMAEVGDTPIGGGADLMTVLTSTTGAAIHNLLLNVVDTGQYAVQIDSWLGGSGNYELTIAGATSQTAVPVPSTLLLFGTTLVGLIAVRRRRT